MSQISQITARKILDSRGQPTVEVKIETDNGLMAVDSVPSGTSTGAKEAALVEIDQAVRNVNQILAPALSGFEVTGQSLVDRKMIDLDGTLNKSKLGANAILGVSLATARVGALTLKKPLFWHLNKLFSEASGQVNEPTLPTPMMVVICGGKHGQNNLCMQEFLSIGYLKDGIKLWQTLKKILKSRKIKTTIGLEGAFSPAIDYDEDAIGLILEALEAANFTGNMRLGFDVAGNNCQISAKEIAKLVTKYPIATIEDPFGEEKWSEFSQLNQGLKKIRPETIVIGDDLFATHKNRLERGIKEGSAGGIIIKLNQVGTVTEALEVASLAKKNHFKTIVSHRSGETTDTFIADFSVAIGADYLKSGAPIPKERLLKYKQLEDIAGEL